MPRRKKKPEWWIVSAVCIACTLTFVAIEIAPPGKPEVIGAAMGPIIGGAFALSEEWRGYPTRVHVSVVAIILGALAIGLLIYKFYLPARGNRDMMKME